MSFLSMYSVDLFFFSSGTGVFSKLINQRKLKRNLICTVQNRQDKLLLLLLLLLLTTTVTVNPTTLTSKQQHDRNSAKINS